MAKRWTPEEDKILRENFENKRKSELTKLLDKEWATIYRRSKKLGLKRDATVIGKDRATRGKRKDSWSEEELSTLKSIYPIGTKKEIQDKLNRPWSGIWGKAYAMGLRRDPEIVKKESIEGGKKVPEREDFWKEEEINLLKEIYVNNTKEFLINKFSRSWKSIRYKANQLGLSRNPDIIKKDNVLGTSKAVQAKYGVQYTTQLESMKRKSRETNLKRRGVEYPSQDPAVRNKVKSTLNKKYGVDNIFQDEPTKEKIKETNIKKYGVPSPLQNEEIYKKVLNTSKEKNTFSSSDEEIKFLMYLKKIDPYTEFQVYHPISKSNIDFYLPSINVWVQYDGYFWHGKIKDFKKGPRKENILKTSIRDERQNSVIDNLVRFDSRLVVDHEKKGDIIEFITDELNKKASKSVCHQYKIKVSTLKNDLENISFDYSKIKAKDFVLKQEKYTKEIKHFIEKYEWLGTIGNNPKWVFTARYKGFLGGVVLINEPNSYSKLLGENTKHFEALIQRGATASWTPKNLGSRLIMFSCKWMTKNTPKRLFVCYADPKANEIGTIYQSCNFSYLGDDFGTGYVYQNKEIKNGLPFSEQSLKRTSAFKAWCKSKGIETKSEWFKDNGYKNIKKIPKEILHQWYKDIKSIINKSVKIPISKKHKYALLTSCNKREKQILEKLKTYKDKVYPKRNSVPVDDFSDFYSNLIKISKNKRTSKRISNNSRITKEKDQYILDNYQSLTQEKIAINLNETKRWVSGRVRSMIKDGILSPKNPIGSTKSRKNKYKIYFIKNNRGTMTYQEMAEHLNENKRWIKRQINIINKEN